ncbi:MAG: PaaI family thioesterase [SAR202 cluster bacterium]|nr:PaaI family thioesterase [SAR202 cluster bacterium]|tara:strand:+ start:40923 stop:41438 length:516 start_codon:yes stop_codon:yes gene_type:complete
MKKNIPFKVTDNILNDNTDYQLCYACGANNTHGLKLKFKYEKEEMSTDYTASECHQGFPNHLHGGITSTILDEVMSRVCLLYGKWGMTASMSIKYIKPITIGTKIRATAKAIRQNRKLIEVSGKIYLPNDSIAIESSAIFLFIHSEKLLNMSKNFPQLSASWKSLYDENIK